MAAFELARRCQMEQPQFYPGIHSSEMAASILIPMLRDLGHEECWILMLNKANKLIGKENICSHITIALERARVLAEGLNKE